MQIGCSQGLPAPQTSPLLGFDMLTPSPSDVDADCCAAPTELEDSGNGTTATGPRTGTGTAHWIGRTSGELNPSSRCEMVKVRCSKSISAPQRSLANWRLPKNHIGVTSARVAHNCCDKTDGSTSPGIIKSLHDLAHNPGCRSTLLGSSHLQRMPSIRERIKAS